MPLIMKNITYFEDGILRTETFFQIFSYAVMNAASDIKKKTGDFSDKIKFGKMKNSELLTVSSHQFPLHDTNQMCPT